MGGRKWQPPQQRPARSGTLDPAGCDPLHVETLIEDPKFYTKPFTYSRSWVAGSTERDQLHEFACSENNIDKDHLGFGPA